MIVGLQPTVNASRAPHLLPEQSVFQDSKNRGRASPVKQMNSQHDLPAAAKRYVAPCTLRALASCTCRASVMLTFILFA